MKKLILAIILSLGVAREAPAQTQLSPGIAELSLSANAGAAPQAGLVFSIPSAANVITWNISFASAPGSHTTILEFSNDNVTFVIGDTSTNVNGESRTVFNASRFLRVTESARSGGGAITVSVIAKTAPVAILQPEGTTNTSKIGIADGTLAAPSLFFNNNPAGGLSSTGLRLFNGVLPEFGGMEWVANFLNVGTTINGGTARSLRLITASPSTNVLISPVGTDRWIFSSAGNLTNNSTGVISVGAAPGTALANSFFSPGVAFAALATPTNGTIIYCTDCAPTTPATCPGTKASCVCTSGGVGSLAIRTNALWYCPF